MNRQELGQLLGLKVELIPTDAPNRSGRAIAPTFITVHNTANTGAGADASAHSRFVREKGFYLRPSGAKNFVSWHYTVDDKRVIKHLPVNERAIHAGKGNGVSVAIEVCMHRGIDQAAANLRASRLVAALMHDLGITKGNVVPHKRWTGKNCPVLLLDDFDNFCSRADAILQSIGDDSSGDALVGEAERDSIEAIRGSGAEEDAEVGPIEDDPDDEHPLIAAEVAKFADPPSAAD